MIDNNKVNINETLTWMFSITAFISMKPYFIWTTFKGGLFSLIFPSSLVITTLFVFFYFVITNKKLKVSDCSLGAFFIVIWVYILTTGTENISYLKIGNYFVLIFILEFFLLTDYDKNAVFDKFSLVFAISLVPSIIISMITLLGFEFSYHILTPEHIGKMLAGFYYKNYIGAVTLHPSYPGYSRLCGMFDEPGVVGTFAALFLVGDNLRLKCSLKNIIIMLAGILSLSLAFYILIFIAYTVKNLTKNIFKFLMILIMLFLMYNSTRTLLLDKFYFLNLFEERFTIQNGMIIGNNRTSISFDMEFNKFIRGNIFKVLFGYGSDASNNNPLMFGSSSYKSLIYDYGIVGFIMILGWIIYATIKKTSLERTSLILMIVFIFSIYQRPNVLSIPYLLLLFGGYSNLKSNSILK